MSINRMSLKLNTLLMAVVLAVSSPMSLAQETASSPAQDGVLDPSLMKEEREASSALFARVLEEKDEESRYKGVLGFIEHYGEWITLSGENVSPKIHISSYLLQTGQSSLAALLVKNGVLNGWMSYRFMDGIANDFIFALKGGHRDYLNALLKYAPKGLNTPMSIQIGGEKVLPLSLMATREYMEMPFYDDILMAMLDAGANPHQKMSSGISPMIVASSSNNMRFVRVVQTYLAGQTKSLSGLMKNTPLEESELVEMQAIADAFIEHSPEKKSRYDYTKLFDMWVQMILKGYNTPADLIYEELKKRKEFDIEGQNVDGLSPLMAASMSPLYGGNVEYAKVLIERGAQASKLTSIPGEDGKPINVNYIQLALTRDNFKIVALMIANQVNFVTAPDDEDVLLLTEAMTQKAYVSATILKEALSKAIKYAQPAKEE